MGRTQMDEKTGKNARVRSVSNCSTSSGSGDEMSGPFKSYDFKPLSGIKKSTQGSAWTDKKSPAKQAYGPWGQTFKNEANFKQMHWC